jgi:hypothetical protein
MLRLVIGMFAVLIGCNPVTGGREHEQPLFLYRFLDSVLPLHHYSDPRATNLATNRSTKNLCELKIRPATSSTGQAVVC